MYLITLHIQALQHKIFLASAKRGKPYKGLRTLNTDQEIARYSRQLAILNSES